MDIEVTIDTILVQRPDRTSATIDEVTAIMDADSDVYLLIDSVGSAIWTRLIEPVRLGDLCAELLEEYEVDPLTCERDVLAFAQDIVRRGLAVRA